MPCCWRYARGWGSARCRISWWSQNPDLVRILPDLKGPKVDVYFVYPEELRNSKRVAVFRDFLLARLAAFH